MSFWYLQFSQKINKKFWIYYYGTSSRIVFVLFLGELKTPKRHFEINWPLVIKRFDREPSYFSLYNLCQNFHVWHSKTFCICDLFCWSMKLRFNSMAFFWKMSKYSRTSVKSWSCLAQWSGWSNIVQKIAAPSKWVAAWQKVSKIHW